MTWQISDIGSSTDFDRRKTLRQQIGFLSLKRKHIWNLISIAQSIFRKEVSGIEF